MPELTFNQDQQELIKSQVARDVTPEELAFFLEVCRMTGLNPLFRQIYAIVRSKDDPKYRTMTIQVGIDGYRLLAARSGALAGIDDAEFDPDPDEPWHPRAARVTVWRFVQGQRVPFTATARWSEYAQRDRKGEYTGMWTKAKMPFAQLAKCAEALALRKASPAELSGFYTHEEMAQADNPPMAYIESESAPQPQRSEQPAKASQPARKPVPAASAAPAAPPAAPHAPWNAMHDPDVLSLLNRMEIRGQQAAHSYLQAVRAEMKAQGLAWVRDQVLDELRTRVKEFDAEEAASGDLYSDADLADIDTGAPGN